VNSNEIKDRLTANALDAETAFEVCRSVASMWHDGSVDLSTSLDLIVRLVAARRELIQAAPGAEGPDPSILADVLKDVHDEQTLIYVRSPRSAAQLADALIKLISRQRNEYLDEFGSWLAESFHPEWMLAKSVPLGLGIHHGRVPRSVGQYLVQLFNRGALPFLICTSTLIEGVNTAAKNVVIYDKYISRSKLDRFTFDNIKGRAGRMFQHYIGRIFLFNPPPEDSEFGVDIPLFNGFEHASDELVVHVPAESLSASARRRREQVLRSSQLPPEILERWSRFGIEGLNAVREDVELKSDRGDDDFMWRGYGTYDEIEAAFEMVWTQLDFEKHGIRSPAQFAYFASSLRQSRSLRQFFDKLVRGVGLSAQDSIDSCFNFLRGSEYTFPEVLRALQDIVDVVVPDRADYSFFARSLQGWFLPGNLRTLDEFGIPLPIIQKIADFLPHDDPDEALAAIQNISDFEGVPQLSRVETRILESATGSA